jgi:hypothetical protein
MVLPVVPALVGVVSSAWSITLTDADIGAAESVAVLAFLVSPKCFAGFVNISDARDAVDATDPDLFLPLGGDIAS